MGIDLTLLPFDCDLPEERDDTGRVTRSAFAYSHTLLDIHQDYALFGGIRDAQDRAGQEVPEGFTCYRATIADGESAGEPTYGAVARDSYGLPLRTLPAGELATIFRRHRKGWWPNTNLTAVAAYLAALPPRRRVAIHWE